MKRLRVIAIMLIFTIMILNACGVQKSNNITYKNTVTQNPSASETSPRVSSTKVTEKPSAIEGNTKPLPIKSIEVSTQELEQYLNSKKSDILKMVGKESETGTVSVIESHMIFPFIFVKGLGLTFIFPNEKDDLNPSYINVNSDTNLKNINVKGAKPGMEFKDIIGKLGNAQVKKTWISSEDNTAYKIDYKLDTVVYSFVSNNEKGTDSQLSVFLADN